jgi:hypothetical protein
MADPAVHPPTTKQTPPQGTSIQARTVEPLQIEEGQPRLRSASVRRRVNAHATRQNRQLQKLLGTLCTYFCVAVMAIAVVAMFDGIWAIFAYYLSYAEIYFNSKVAINIFRNDHTAGAYRFFYWAFALLACFPNALVGAGIGFVGYLIGKGLKLPGCILLFWMVPWVVPFLITKSITFWVRPLVSDYYQAKVFDNTCAVDGWDLDITLGASTLTETLPVVGNANVTSTALSGGINYTTQLVRHVDNHLRFDFVVTSISGSVDPPFTNITYDWQNSTYVVWGPNSTNISGTYTTTPSLSFPSIHLSTLDESIPFQRPNYDECWAAAATLVLRNSSSLTYQNVLKSITLDPADSTRLKVCGMAGSVAEELQISLGVVFIDHFYYSLCVTSDDDSNN